MQGRGGKRLANSTVAILRPRARAEEDTGGREAGWRRKPNPNTCEMASEAAAMIDPTYDSNKSAPMPATSPTLSPTLSAMTAGLCGSSSSMPASTWRRKRESQRCGLSDPSAALDDSAQRRIQSLQCGPSSHPGEGVGERGAPCRTSLLRPWCRHRVGWACTSSNKGRDESLPAKGRAGGRPREQRRSRAHLADQVCPDVGGLGVDASGDAREEGDGGGAETETGQALHHLWAE